MGPVYDVAVVVFYDENGDRQLSSTELVRLPDVVVEAARQTARTAAEGRTVLSGVPGGSVTVSLRSESLPPFYQAPAPMTVQVPLPAGSSVTIPVALPIGTNRANRYMAFGDSITVGDGSSDGNGYRYLLQAELVRHLGAALIFDEGESGTRSNAGALRIGSTVAVRRPAYTLILYGTNDWNDCGTTVPCYTVDSLRAIIRSVKGSNSLPVIGTIIPANPSYPITVPPERNQWIKAINALVRPMAREEGASLADLEAVFLREPSLPDLFTDHIHPNDHGYQIIADEFFRAITAAPSGTSTLSAFPFGFFAFDTDRR